MGDEWIELMKACENGNTQRAKVLLDNGAPVNQKNSAGLFALLMTSLTGHTETAKLLLENGAQVNLQDSVGWSALMAACDAGHTELALLLVDKGANVNLRSRMGETAMSLAKSKMMLDALMLAMIPQLIKILQPISSKWKDLGLHLGLTMTMLNPYQIAFEEDKDRLQAVMTTWSSKGNPRATCRVLIGAVRLLDAILAQRIEKLVGKYPH